MHLLFTSLTVLKIYKKLCIKIDSTKFLFSYCTLWAKNKFLCSKNNLYLFGLTVSSVWVCVCVFMCVENKRHKEITRKLSHNLAPGTHCFYYNLPTVFSRCICCSLIDFEEFHLIQIFVQIIKVNVIDFKIDYPIVKYTNQQVSCPVWNTVIVLTPF